MTKDRGPRPTVAEERAAAQARNRELRASNRARVEEHTAANVSSGMVLRRFVVAVTVVHVALTTLAVIWLERFEDAVAVLSLILFMLGMLMFLVAMARGAQRSRESELTIAGWFFLAGSAPRRVQLELVGSTALQAAVPVAAAAIHPYTRLAFGILVPMFGLAACGMWSARNGWFPDRVEVDR